MEFSETDVNRRTLAVYRLLLSPPLPLSLP